MNKELSYDTTSQHGTFSEIYFSKTLGLMAGAMMLFEAEASSGKKPDAEKSPASAEKRLGSSAQAEINRAHRNAAINGGMTVVAGAGIAVIGGSPIGALGLAAAGVAAGVASYANDGLQAHDDMQKSQSTASQRTEKPNPSSKSETTPEKQAEKPASANASPQPSQPNQVAGANASRTVERPSSGAAPSRGEDSQQGSKSKGGKGKAPRGPSSTSQSEPRGSSGGSGSAGGNGGSFERSRPESRSSI